MEKLNLPPFYIGETVEYITGISMPKGSRHVVSDMYQSRCGCWMIEIDGNKLNPFDAKTIITRCYECNTAYPSHIEDKDKGWDPKSFRSIQKQSYPLMTFKEIVKKEKEEILINN